MKKKNKINGKQYKLAEPIGKIKRREKYIKEFSNMLREIIEQKQEKDNKSKKFRYYHLL